MARFILTPDDLKNAKTYLPIGEKMAFIAENAPKCFDRLQITADKETMPPMYMENTALKSRYMMYALTAKYLGLAVETEKDDNSILTESEYDRFAGITAQIDRLKKNKEVQDAAYELANDYYDLEKRMNVQIRGLLEVQNDPVMRQQMLMSQSMAELPKLMGELQKLQEKREKGDGK